MNKMDIVPTPAPHKDLPAEVSQVKFNFGIIQSECAPHDASSLAITLGRTAMQCDYDRSKRDEPRIFLNIWERAFVAGPPVGGDWQISVDHSGNGSICMSSTCESFSSVRIKILEKSGTGEDVKIKGRLENLKTYNGKNIPNQTFELKWCHHQAICG